MAGADEDSRIRDGVRNSKILWDALSKNDQKLDAFAIEMHRELYGLKHEVEVFSRQQEERVFPRLAVGEHVRYEQQRWNYVGFTSSFNEGDSEFHGCKEMEDPFHGFYHRYGGLIAKFKKNLPVFDGFWHTEDLMNWIDAIEDFFEEINPPEHLKCKIVWYKMKGAAYYWWKLLQKDRFSEGKNLISSWPRMKKLLLKRFMPATCSKKLPSNIELKEGNTQNSNFMPSTCLVKVPLQPVSSNQGHEESIPFGLNHVRPKRGDTNSSGAEVKLTSSATTRATYEQNDGVNAKSHAITKMPSKEEIEATTSVGNIWMQISEKKKDTRDKGNEESEDTGTSSIELKDKPVCDDVGNGNGNVRASLGNQSLEEQEAETNNKEGGSSHGNEAVDWELPNEKHYVETVALAYPNAEYCKTEEKPLDKLIGSELVESGDQTNVMLDHLKRGDVNGQNIGVEHDANNLSVVLNGRLDMSLQLGGGSAEQLMRTDSCILDTMNTKPLVNGLVQKCSSNVIMANIQYHSVNHSLGRLHEELANINVQAFLSFDPGGIIYSSGSWNYVSHLCFHTFIMFVIKMHVGEKASDMLCGKSIMLRIMEILLYIGDNEEQLHHVDLNSEQIPDALSIISKQLFEPSMVFSPCTYDISHLELSSFNGISVEHLQNTSCIMYVQPRGLELLIHVSLIKEEFNRAKFLIESTMGLILILSSNKNYMNQIGGEYMVSINSIAEFLTFLFDPGGVPFMAIMTKFDNFFYFNFGISLDCTILRIDVRTILLWVKNDSSWVSCMMLKGKTSKINVSCLCSWLDNTPGTLVRFVMVIFLKSSNRIGSRIHMGALWLHGVCKESILASLICCLELPHCQISDGNNKDVFCVKVLYLCDVYASLPIKGVRHRPTEVVSRKKQSSCPCLSSLLHHSMEYNVAFTRKAELLVHVVISFGHLASLHALERGIGLHNHFLQDFLKGVWASLEQQLEKTRGRVILWEGWNDENNCNTFIMARRSVGTISLYLSIVGKNGQFRRTLKLFHKVVNGLDPPMNLLVSSGV